MRKPLPLILTLSLVFAWATAINAKSYDNVYLSYISPANVSTITEYAKVNDLAGVFMWTIKDDTTWDSLGNDSLLGNILQAYNPDRRHPEHLPKVNAYYPNWAVYNQTALENTSYPFADDNKDLKDKISGLNTITYAFLETQTKTVSAKNVETKEVSTTANPFPNEIGSLYFIDPWSDLAPDPNQMCKMKQADDKRYSDDRKTTYNNICWFAYNKNIYPKPADASSKPNPDNFAYNAKFGNFEHFAAITRSAEERNPYGDKIYKIAAIGGYGHDDSFEDVFGNENYQNNFIRSAKTIIDNFHLDGIDLDYENPNMTLAQSEQYAQLILKLRQALPDKLIFITILSDPSYINGTKSAKFGFSQAAWNTITSSNDIGDKNNYYINLMTYDFFGVHSSQEFGMTGLLSSLRKEPRSYPYSIEDSVNTLKSVLENAGVSLPNKRINIGIPAYGHALQGIDSGYDQTGFGQSIPSDKAIPKGNIDNWDCNDNIKSPTSLNKCSGSFQYRFIVNNLLKSGFHATDWPNSVGTTAYAATYQLPPDSHTLTINNNGTRFGFKFSIQNASKSFKPDDYFNPGKTVFYHGHSDPSTSSIDGQNDLVIHWDATFGGHQGECSKHFNFNKDLTINIGLIADDAHGTVYAICSGY